MPIVYRAASMIDAQMVLDDLIAAGMKARIQGGYLSGAIGELPPDQLISVWIDQEMHFDRARQVVEEFEATQRLRGAERPCPNCDEMLAPQFGRCWRCGAWQAVE